MNLCTVMGFVQNIFCWLQDAPSGAPLQKSMSSFAPLDSALTHPWKKLSARFTHKLVYALRGESSGCKMLSPKQS